MAWNLEQFGFFADADNHTINLPAVTNRKLIVDTSSENVSGGFNITTFDLNGMPLAQVTDGVTPATAIITSGGTTNQGYTYFIDIPDGLVGNVPLDILHDQGYAGKLDQYVIYTGLAPGNAEFTNAFGAQIKSNTLAANPSSAIGVIAQFASCGDQGAWAAGVDENLIQDENGTSMSGMTSEKGFTSNAATSMFANSPVNRRLVQTTSVWAEAAAGVSAPILDAASITIDGADSVAVFPTMNVTIPAASDRLLCIFVVPGADETPVPVVSTVTWDAAGAIKTIGSGITLQGVRLEAKEGNISSQCSVYFIKEQDLGSAGTYTLDIGMSGDVFYSYALAFCITGCPQQAYDNLVQNTSLVNIPGGTDYSETITPVDDDCLIVDMHSVSTGSGTNSWTISAGQTLVSEQTNFFAGVICTEHTQVGAASAKIMTQNSSLEIRRRAVSLLSFSGAPVVMPSGRIMGPVAGQGGIAGIHGGIAG